jgi:hypothetical protein
MATQYHGCSKCPAKWTGLSPCHCSGCHQTFGGITGRNFKCLDPTSIGLALNDAGVWVLPAPVFQK